MRLVINSTRVRPHPSHRRRIDPHKNFHFKTSRHRVVGMALFLSYGRACVRNRANSMCARSYLLKYVCACFRCAAAVLLVLLRMLCSASKQKKRTRAFGLFVLVTCSWIISHVNRSSVLYLYMGTKATDERYTSQCSFTLCIRWLEYCLCFRFVYKAVPQNAPA